MKQIIITDENGVEQVFESASLAADFLGVGKSALTNAIAREAKIGGKYTAKVHQKDESSQEISQSSQEVHKTDTKQPESQPKKKVEDLTPTKELQAQKAQMIKITNHKTGIVSKHFLSDLEYLLDLTPEQAKEAVEKGTKWYDHSVELIPFDENYDVAKQQQKEV